MDAVSPMGAEVCLPFAAVGPGAAAVGRLAGVAAELGAGPVAAGAVAAAGFASVDAAAAVPAGEIPAVAGVAV